MKVTTSLPSCAQPLGEPLGLLEHARGVGAGQTAVAGHDQHGGPARVVRLGGQRVLLVGVGDQCRDRPRQLTGVWRRLLGPLLRLDDAGRSDELHGAGDLLGGLHRLDPRAVLTQRHGHQ